MSASLAQVIALYAMVCGLFILFIVVEIALEAYFDSGRFESTPLFRLLLRIYLFFMRFFDGVDHGGREENIRRK